MECPICTETFNRRNHKIVQCHYCFYQACHECVGKFLLEKMECMNCHKEWDYDFLCSQMTKTFLSNPYKENMKKKLMMDIEKDLGNYQEISVLLNQKEEKKKQLDMMGSQLSFLENELAVCEPVIVFFHDKPYTLYIKAEKTIPEQRKGSFIIHYIQKLVNPPPPEEDRIKVEIKKKSLLREKTYYKIMYSYSILNLNMFHTDKFLIAVSADIHRDFPLSDNDRNDFSTKIEEAKKEYIFLLEKLKVFYDGCKEETAYQYDEEEFHTLITKCRKASRGFWKYFFRVHPPTPEDFNLIETDKKKYVETMNYYKTKLKQCIWDLEDVHENINSNLQYLYNLDDRHLHQFSEKVDDPSITIRKLEMEEQKWNTFHKQYQDEIHTLTPIYNKLWNEFTELKKKIRKLNKKTSISHYILSCPSPECIGKIGTDGTCGLCGKRFCQECGQEKYMDRIHLCKKEDIESINELKKNTRPCPRCHIPIYKIEGCDQMWCVQCHTTFSWKTGAITHGVVHNPHFYDYRRHQTHVVHRTPGDIPCGGLPNEIEIISAIGRQNKPSMYVIWEYTDNLSEKLMPSIYRKFHNVRPMKYRQYSISYLRGKINKKRLETLLYKNYLDEIRYAYYYEILDTLVDNLAEYLRQFVNGLDTEKECLSLLTIMEYDIAIMNKKYNMQIRWNWSG